MRRKILVLLAMAGMASSSALAGGPELVIPPDYFSGFFVGGTGAFHATGFNGDSSTATQEDVVISIPVSSTVTLTQIMFPSGTLAGDDIDGNDFSGFYGVQGGVGKVFNHRWYLGIVGFGEWGNQSDTQVSTSQFEVQNVPPVPPDPPSNGAATGTYTSSTTVKISNDYGVAAKPGILVAPTTLVYGKIGAIWAHLKVSNNFAGTSESTGSIDPTTGQPTYQANAQINGSSSNDDTKIALLLGVGFEQFIYHDFVTINVEYDYANYGTVSTSTPLSATASASVEGTTINDVTLSGLDGSFTQASANAKVSTLLAGLNFYFGSHWF